MPNITDFLIGSTAGSTFPVVGVWVRLTNNLTSAQFVSTAATDTVGTFTVLNVPAGSYTVATGPTNTGPFTSTTDTNYFVGADVNATLTTFLGGVAIAGADPWVDITATGGVADGVTDNTAALVAALARVPSTGGGVYFPANANAYAFASAWSLTSKSFVRLRGAGPARTGGAGGTSTIMFTGTTGPLVAATGTTGIELEDLYFRWPNTYTGTVVDFSGTTFTRVAGCSFIATSGASTATAAFIVGLDNATRALIERSVFHNAQVAVQGVGTSGHFSNVVTIRDCNFNTAAANGDIAVACIQNPGQGWLIQGNTFEMGTAAGVLNAIGQTFGGSLGVAVTGNWFGDAGTGAIIFIDINGDGWLVLGNMMGSNSNVSSALVQVESGANGLSVVGNRIQNAGIGVNYIGNNRDSLVFGNRFNGVTSFNSGTPISGILQTSTGSGGPRVLGALQRSFQSPTEAVLVSGVDVTLGESVSVTLTAARLVGAPLNPNTGDRLYFTFTQGGAGAFAVTWNAVFKVTWSDTGNTTGKISTVGFWYNGTNWCQIAAQAPYV